MVLRLRPSVCLSLLLGTVVGCSDPDWVTPDARTPDPAVPASALRDAGTLVDLGGPGEPIDASTIDAAGGTADAEGGDAAPVDAAADAPPLPRDGGNGREGGHGGDGGGGADGGDGGESRDVAPPPRCGDGRKDPSESCDLGANNSDDGYGEGACTKSCRILRCGDGAKNGPEACDRGAQNNATAYGRDQCTAECEAAPYCGDGARQDGREDCDRGADNKADAYGAGQCTTDCKTAPFCGDGKPAMGEECDAGPNGNDGAPGGCDATCKRVPAPKTLRPVATPTAGTCQSSDAVRASCLAKIGSTDDLRPEDWLRFIACGDGTEPGGTASELSNPTDLEYVPDGVVLAAEARLRFMTDAAGPFAFFCADKDGIWIELRIVEALGSQMSQEAKMPLPASCLLPRIRLRVERRPNASCLMIDHRIHCDFASLQPTTIVRSI